MTCSHEYKAPHGRGRPPSPGYDGSSYTTTTGESGRDTRRTVHAHASTTRRSGRHGAGNGCAHDCIAFRRAISMAWSSSSSSSQAHCIPVRTGAGPSGDSAVERSNRPATCAPAPGVNGRPSGVGRSSSMSALPRGGCLHAQDVPGNVGAKLLTPNATSGESLNGRTVLGGNPASWLLPLPDRRLGDPKRRSQGSLRTDDPRGALDRVVVHA